MIIKAGNICKNSVRSFPIKNLVIKPIGWSTIHLSVDSNVITKICNNNKELEFKMEITNSGISLLVNKISYYSSNNIFDYDIDINIDETKYKLQDVIIFIDDLFYDS